MAEELSVRVVRGAVANEAEMPQIGVEVRDADLAEALIARLDARLGQALRSVPVPEIRVASDADLGAVAGALVLVDAGDRAPDALLAHVQAIEAAGAAGIQLVWPGRPRKAEAAVFAALEAWRGARVRCPLMLAPDEAPLPMLLRAMRRVSPG